MSSEAEKMPQNKHRSNGVTYKFAAPKQVLPRIWGIAIILTGSLIALSAGLIKGSELDLRYKGGTWWRVTIKNQSEQISTYGILSVGALTIAGGLYLSAQKSHFSNQECEDIKHHRVHLDTPEPGELFWEKTEDDIALKLKSTGDTKDDISKTIIRCIRREEFVYLRSANGEYLYPLALMLNGHKEHGYKSNLASADENFKLSKVNDIYIAEYWHTCKQAEDLFICRLKYGEVELLSRTGNLLYTVKI